MSNNDIFFDEDYEFKGYIFTIFRDDVNIPITFSMSEDEFNLNKELITWMDFLIRTNQWIPYAVWKDLFGITECDYIGLKEVKDMKIHYVEIINKIKDIKIY